MPILEISLGVSALVLGVVGFFAGSAYRKKSAEKSIGSAEEEAKRILNDAMKAAETKKREALLEAKDEIHQLRQETERDLRERRSEVQRQEHRIQQKEESLDRKIDNLESEVIQGFKDVNTAIDNIQEGVFDIITEEDINDLFKEEDPDPGDEPEPSRPENNSEHTGSGKGTFGGAEEVTYDEWSIDVDYLGYSTEQDPGGVNGACQVTESPKADGEYDSNGSIDFPLIFSSITGGDILSITITASNSAQPDIFEHFVFEADSVGYRVESDGTTWTLITDGTNNTSSHITINYDDNGKDYIRSRDIQSITVKTVKI